MQIAKLIGNLAGQIRKVRGKQVAGAPQAQQQYHKCNIECAYTARIDTTTFRNVEQHVREPCEQYCMDKWQRSTHEWPCVINAIE